MLLIETLLGYIIGALLFCALTVAGYIFFVLLVAAIEITVTKLTDKKDT